MLLNCLPAPFRQFHHVLGDFDLVPFISIIHAAQLVVIADVKPSVVPIFIKIVIAVKTGKPLPPGKNFPAIHIPASISLLIQFFRTKLFDGGDLLWIRKA